MFIFVLSNPQLPRIASATLSAGALVWSCEADIMLQQILLAAIVNSKFWFSEEKNYQATKKLAKGMLLL